MRTLLPFLLLSFLFFACKKESVSELAKPESEFSSTSNSSEPSYYENEICGLATVTSLMAGQTNNVGSVTVSNNSNFVFVTYQTTGSYLLKKTHLYVGTLAGLPVNNAGNPQIGQFPFQTNHGGGVSTYTYTIPRSSLPGGCLTVAAHAEIIAYGANGSINYSETGWGNGTQINNGGSWAMRFSHCLQECVEGPR